MELMKNSHSGPESAGGFISAVLSRSPFRDRMLAEISEQEVVRES